MSESTNESKLLSVGAAGLQIAVGVAAVGAVAAGVFAIGSVAVGAILIRRFVKHQRRNGSLGLPNKLTKSE